MKHSIWVLPAQRNIPAEAGSDLLTVLRRAGFAPDAPCGGQGTCGKCKVLVDGEAVLACRVTVEKDMTVTLPAQGEETILTTGISGKPRSGEGYALAFDIGTTTVAGCLLRCGKAVAYAAMPNPQRPFGGDVVTRIQRALAGDMEAMTGAIRDTLGQMIQTLCADGGITPGEILTVSVVGNPAMQQIFLGMLPENLAKLPFAPVLKKAEAVEAKAYLSALTGAKLLTVPDISGFVGADTVGCLLASEPEKEEMATLLVDIGTNGEMVLCYRGRMAACSAAAGPALEGANIQFGMRAQNGAIDHVWIKDGKLVCSVIGGGEAAGICGSGLIDAAAVALELGWINERGKIAAGERISLTEQVYLTQEDIRQVQLAKGAIAAGIQLLQAHLGVPEIEKVYLAGAFGTFLKPQSACRIGLLPGIPPEKIQSIGNAALSGAMLLAADPAMLEKTQALVDQTEALELGAVPGFQRCFAKNMRF